MRKELVLDGKIAKAFVVATADNQCDVFVNDKKALQSDDWSQLETTDVSQLLRPGKNVISIAAKNQGGPAGVLAALFVKLEDGKTIELVSDATWKGSDSAKGAAWRKADFDDSGWKTVDVIGAIGESKLPWSGSVDRDALLAAFGNGTASGEFIPEIAKNAQVPDGFKIEKVFQVPRSMGSWVSMSFACRWLGQANTAPTP